MTTPTFSLKYQTDGYNHCCGVTEIGSFYLYNEARRRITAVTAAEFKDQKDAIVAAFKESITGVLTAKESDYTDDDDNWIEGDEEGPTCLVATVTHTQPMVEEVLVAAGFKLNFEFTSRTTGSLIRHYYITTDML